MANNKLFNVVYTPAENGNLKTFLSEDGKSYNVLYVRNVVDGEPSFEKMTINELYNVSDKWDIFRGDADKKLYALNREVPFVFISFDSRDIDSKIAKDIVCKYYGKVEDWKELGVVVYDTHTRKPEYSTYEEEPNKYKMFDPSWLIEAPVNEVFLCGVTLDRQLVKAIAANAGSFYVFENNPYKINEVSGVARTQRYGKLCTTSTSKSWQAFSLFKDPIGNLRISDNVAVKTLKQYSDAVCHVMASDVERTIDTVVTHLQSQEKVIKEFEKQMNAKPASGKLSNMEKLVMTLWGEPIPDGNDPYVFNATSNYTNSTFDALVETYPTVWANGVLALNTKEVPSVAKIKELVSDVNKRKYTKIVTFYKNDNSFWTLNVYTLPRPIDDGTPVADALATDSMNVPCRYYLKSGIQVIKVVRYGANQKPVAVEWFNISGKKNVPVNVYNVYKGSSRDDSVYKFFQGAEGKPAQYVVYNDSDFADDKCLKNSLTGELMLYKRSTDPSNIIFENVYADNEDINFNNWSAVRSLSSKYLCYGNDYIVTATLTDKQMYDCLKSKSL